MRQALKRLYRWIGEFRVARTPARSRPAVCLCLENLEERVVMTSLLDAPVAPAQSIAVATMTLTSPAATATMQDATSVFPASSGLTVSYNDSGTNAAALNAGSVVTVQLSGLTGAMSTSAANQLPEIFKLDDGSSLANQLLLPGGVPSVANPPSAAPGQLTTLGSPTSAQALSAPPLITPSALSMPPNHALDLQSPAFRISRTPADASPLQVAFVQTVYGPSGTVAQEGIVSFVPRSTHVNVPLAWGFDQPADPPEIVTLTLRGDGCYRVAQPTATLFLADATRGCSESALLEAFRQGQSTEAFNALFQLHRSAVFQTCIGLLRNLADAEDVTQVVFLMLARQPLRLGMNMAGWLRTVARHACIGLMRSRSRRVRHEKNAAKAEHVQGDDELIDLREELDAALTQLAPDLGEAVRLRYLEGWSQQQAAERLGCPRGTLSQRASRGIQSLRDILGSAAD
jgi:RNA polymerase sigma factor (sigma-70 family)